MTNFSLSSALKFSLSAVLFALIAGCGPKDGVRELAEGRAAFAVGDLKKAEKLYLRAAKLNPTNADAAVSLAELRLRQGELSEAKKAIATAERLAGDDFDVRLLAAQIAWHAKDYVRAEKLFRGVADEFKFAPEVRAQGFTGLGIVQMTCDEHEFARLSFLRALRLDRRCASAWYHLGQLYRFEPFGYNEIALDHFEIFVRLEANASPRVQKTQRVIIPALKDLIAQAATDRPGAAKRNSAACAELLMKAEAAWKKGAYKTARNQYQAALQADPLSYPAALGFARAIDKTDSSGEGKDRALTNYRLACTLRPSAVSTCLEAGRLAEGMRFYAQAREIYSRAVAANPASLDAIDGLIRAIRKTGGGAKLAKEYQAYRDTLPKGKKR